MLVDHISQTPDEIRYLVDDCRPRCLRHHEAQVEVRVPVSGSAPDRALHLERDEPRISFDLAQGASQRGAVRYKRLG